MSALLNIDFGPKRVGHKGAGLLAPGNTRASFDAAVAAGVDMLEFDVIRDRTRNELVLAHDHRVLKRGTVLSLEEGLDYLSDKRFNGLEFDVDLKLPGYESEAVAALRRHELIDRSLICSCFPWSLTRVRRLEPSARLGWSIPMFRSSRVTVGGNRSLVAMTQRVLPGRASVAIRSGQCNSIMVDWRLVTRKLVDSVKEAGGEVYAWTVDEANRIGELAEIGVNGIISNDPRLFSALRA